MPAPTEAKSWVAVIVQRSPWRNSQTVRLDHGLKGWLPGGCPRLGTFSAALSGYSRFFTSSFLAKKLDTLVGLAESMCMSTRAATAGIRQRSIAGRIRARIEGDGERVWRAADFQSADRAWTAQAIAQALSRLSRQGVVRRLGRGLYYRGRETAFGPSLPSPAMVQSLPITGRKVFPSGHAAASMLGLTTQQPSRPEIATTGGSLPRLIVGKQTIIRTRRPESWRSLDAEDAVILEVLRQRGSTSELSADETARRLLAAVNKPGRFVGLCRVAASEPPRVRAMLGAIGQQLRRSPQELTRLRSTLNPLSKFDFGKLAALKHAAEWQARLERSRASVSAS